MKPKQGDKVYWDSRLPVGTIKSVRGAFAYIDFGRGSFEPFALSDLAPTVEINTHKAAWRVK